MFYVTQPEMLALVAIARFADLFTTWLISPDLRYELNPLIRKLGWKWTLALNFIFCPFVVFWPAFFWSLLGLSMLAFLWNLRILNSRP